MYRQVSTHFEEHGSKYGFGSVFVTCVLLFSFGVQYIVLGNSFHGTYTGTLVAVKVFQQTSCNKNSCSTTYYIQEIFTKGLSSSTCTVQRLTPYYFAGDANNVMQNAILGTTRTVYQTYYDPGTCIDDTIRNYYNAIGWPLFSVCMFIIIIVLGFYFPEKIKELWDYSTSYFSGPDVGTADLDIISVQV